MPFLSRIELDAQLETRRETMITILEVRFGEVAPELIEVINAIKNMPVLKQLYRQAIAIPSIKEFQQVLQQALSSETLPIYIPREKIAEFCQRHHIRKLSLFGSVLREDFRPDSDIDFLVEFEPGKTPSFFELFRMETELSQMLEGRKIDLRTPNELSPYFRDRVMASALVQYGD